MRFTIALLLLAGFAVPAAADKIVLKNGGTINGTIQDITTNNGKGQKTYLRSEISEVMLNPGGIVLVAGGAESTEIVSVKIRSVGGFLDFQRAEIANVVLVDAEQLKQEYAKRLDALNEKNAPAVCALAQWCMDNDMKVQARELARKALAAHPDADSEKIAREILGHYMVNGQWVDPSQAPSSDEEIASPPTDQASDDASAQKSNPELFNLRRQLIKEYGEKVGQLLKRDMDAVRTQYEKDYLSASTKVKTLTDGIQKNNEEISRLEQYIVTERKNKTPDRSRISDWQNQEQDIRKRVTDQQAQLEKAKTEQSTIEAKVKSAQVQARRSDSKRRQALSIAESKSERLILYDKTFTADAMRELFIQACGE